MKTLQKILVVFLFLMILTSQIFATRTVIDHAGNEVEIPNKIERIVISAVRPLPSVYCLFEGDASKLVGIHPSSMAAAQNSILPDIMPDILNVSTDFAQGGTVNIEEVLALDPDIVFYNSADIAEGEMYRLVGIPAVAFSTANWGSDVLDTFNGWVTLLGEVLQQEDKVAGIVEYGEEVENFVRARLAENDDIDRPRALIIQRYDSTSMTVSGSGSGSWAEYWIDAAGGINVASEVTGFPTVNMEQIYEWNPEMIFITNFAPVLPEDLYNNAIEGDDWSHVEAVQLEQVYKFPLGMYRWFPPSSDTPLSLLWMAKHLQPELFVDVDMDQTIKDYYLRFYGIEVSDEILNRIYNPSRDAAY